MNLASCLLLRTACFPLQQRPQVRRDHSCHHPSAPSAASKELSAGSWRNMFDKEVECAARSKLPVALNSSLPPEK
jgi:hypothetical protein